jgi:hypothetical protein
MNALTPSQIEQLRSFSECFILHPQVEAVFKDFDELRLNRHFQSDQQCMLLTGDTGVGKSHLINHYKKHTLASQNCGRDTMPVLVSRISRGRGLDATLVQIISDLELFGSHQRSKRGYATDLTKKLVNSLIRANVELLIINEFQELIEFKTVQERQLIANALKFISEEARVPIVIVGMPWAEQIADEPQWSSRLVRRRKLEYFSLKVDRNYYLKYLKGLAKYMPFDEPPKLEDRSISIPLFAASRGENRALKHLLLESAKIALSNHSVSLETDHLSDAFDRLFGKNTQKNPFCQPLDEVLISELSKPSHYNANAMSPEDMLVSREFSKPQSLAQLLSK